MELNDFIALLEEALIKRGLSPAEAEKQAHNFRRSLVDEDLQDIKSLQPIQVEGIAENIVRHVKKKKAQSAAGNGTPKTDAPARTAPASSAPSRRQAPSAPQRRSHADSPRRPEQDFSYDEPFNEVQSTPTQKGFYIFWLVFIFTLPITVALAAAFFGVFIGVFAALSALIVGLIAGLIGLVAIGAGVSLVGIIFGITQLFSFVAAGIYEIGLGVMVIGVVMLVGILIYNVAIRFLPWVIRMVAVLLRFTCGKLRDLFVYLRKECYKL